MIITRCDACKKTSDEAGVGYIGRTHEAVFKEWERGKPIQQLIITVTTDKDLCQPCFKEFVAKCNFSERKEY